MASPNRIEYPVKLVKPTARATPASSSRLSLPMQTIDIILFSDIYIFDMVILELVKGKHLIDPEYEEKDLVKWVSTTLNEEEIDHKIDPNLGSYHKEEICKFLNIGLLCTNPAGLGSGKPSKWPSLGGLGWFHKVWSRENMRNNAQA
ncbi:hypothetical protein Syun_013858 [Stephania yunnanensis]|uniref:non-specific serine/threonine protein kinase n=1 Tax=Stephania yunnanensis TaxID=152371 RepID=A0AAP0P836_9MAGN